MMFTIRICIVILLVINFNSAQIIAPQYGKNVCRYFKEKVDIILRKNISFTKQYYNKSCGIASRSDLVCPEMRIKSRIYWYPFQRKRKYKIYKCCPGWKRYISGKGCTKRVGCKVSLPQNEDKTCQHKRWKRLSYERLFYKLSSPKPSGKHSLLLNIPTMNQTTTNVMLRTMLDPFTAHWFNVYFRGMLMRNNKTLHALLKGKLLPPLKFSRIQDYKDLSQVFVNSALSTGLPYFRLPSTEPGFRDITKNNEWLLDKYFVEQRLAGLNPMSLQKVTIDGSAGMKWNDLKMKLNPSFDLEEALQDAICLDIPLISAIEEGLLYITYYPTYHDIPHVPDITDYDPNDEKTMMNSTSPIGIFAIGKDKNGQNELKAVAIQWDFKPSPVYKPKDGIMWQIAKLQHQIADFAVSEIYEHLLKTHLRLEPFCVCIQRHFAPHHPLHQILKFHCRGLITTNSYGFPKLTSKHSYMHLLFAMGHVGTMKLLNEGFTHMKWGDDDLIENIKKRGLDDKNLLPFYPYRDDGEVIVSVLESFGKEYVDLYYTKNKDVVNDYELQRFLNEVSSEGTGLNGGKGRVKGLPPKFTNKRQVSDLIKQILWIVVQHAAVNYPIIAYCSFPPNMPSKLYEDVNKPTINIVEALPKGKAAYMQTFVTSNLGTMRYDVMFDYYNQLEDTSAKYLVQKYYKKMMKEVKPALTSRNNERYNNNHLTYPYLVPGWIPNGINT